MKKVFLFVLFFFLSAGLSHAFTLSDFDTPESVQADPADGSYYVSNVNGSPTEKDGNGYISKISSNGNTVIHKFIGGKKDEPVLDAPKGIAIVKDELYVTDIDSVKVFNKHTRRFVRKIDFAGLGAQFLNDITSDAAGNLYVSDMFGNRIYKIRPSKNDEISVVKEGPELGQPNGLVINPKTKNLMVVTWGSGRVLEIDPAGRVHVLKRGLVGLDGIDYDNDGSLYVSSFKKGEIYKISFYGRGTLSIFLSGLTTPADVSFDRKKNEILIPSFDGRTVATLSRTEILTRKSSSAKS